MGFSVSFFATILVWGCSTRERADLAQKIGKGVAAAREINAHPEKYHVEEPAAKAKAIESVLAPAQKGSQDLAQMLKEPDQQLEPIEPEKVAMAVVEDGGVGYATEMASQTERAKQETEKASFWQGIFRRFKGAVLDGLSGIWNLGSASAVGGTGIAGVASIAATVLWRKRRRVLKALQNLKDDPDVPNDRLEADIDERDLRKLK